MVEVASQRWHACIYVTCVVLSFTHINQTRPHTSGGRPADHSSKIHSPPHTRDAQSLTGCCPGPCTPSWFRRLLLRCLGLGLGALVWSLARRLCRVVMGKEGSGPGRSRPRVGGQVRPVASEHGAGRDSIDCVNHVVDRMMPGPLLLRPDPYTRNGVWAMSSRFKLLRSSNRRPVPSAPIELFSRGRPAASRPRVVGVDAWWPLGRAGRGAQGGRRSDSIASTAQTREAVARLRGQPAGAEHEKGADEAEKPTLEP